MGRWISRDPASERMNIELNRTVFIKNNPVTYYEILGLWASDMHKDVTTMWAVEVGYKYDAADKIGIYDDEVDEGLTGPYYGNQSYHFNRSGPSGSDSRIDLYREHLQKAKDYCDKRLDSDNPYEAAKQLGKALHPLQDWVAHGDFGLYNQGRIYAPHNIYSDQDLGGGNSYDRALARIAAVDDPNMDSEGSDGRAAGSAMRYRDPQKEEDFAYFFPGRKRYYLTAGLTKAALVSFLNHINENAKECGECLKYFPKD